MFAVLSEGLRALEEHDSRRLRRHDGPGRRLGGRRPSSTGEAARGLRRLPSAMRGTAGVGKASPHSRHWGE